MALKIIYTSVDGALCVISPNYRQIKDGESFADFAKRIAESDVPVTLTDSAEVIALRLGVELGRQPTMIRRHGAIANGLNYRETLFTVVDESEIPVDRTFRNAWKADCGKITHDMDKCREIHKSKLRELRAPKLSALDVEYMRALELGDSVKMQSIAAQKQALRDVTKAPELTAAKTPDELKAAIPAILKG